jgi:hypothetical protein
VSFSTEIDNNKAKENFKKAFELSKTQTRSADDPEKIDQL